MYLPLIIFLSHKLFIISLYPMKGLGPMYNVSNPYKMMSETCLSMKAAFFERQVGEYTYSTTKSENGPYTSDWGFKYYEDF